MNALVGWGPARVGLDPSGFAPAGPYDRLPPALEEPFWEGHLEAAQAGFLQQGNPGGEEITTLWVGNVPPGTLDEEMAGVFSSFGSLVCCFLLKKLSPQGQLSGFVRYHNRLDASQALAAVQANAVFLRGAAVTAKWASQNSKPLGSSTSQTSEMGSSPASGAVQQRVQEIIMEAIRSTQNSPPSPPPPPRPSPIVGMSSMAMVPVASPRMTSWGEEITTLWVGNVPPGSTDQDLSNAFASYGTLLACFLFKTLSPQGQMSGFVRFLSRAEAGIALQAVEAQAVSIRGTAVRARWASENSKVSKGMEGVTPSSGPSSGFQTAPQARSPRREQGFGSQGFGAPGPMEGDSAVQAIAKILEAVVPQLAQKQSMQHHHHHHQQHHQHHQSMPMLPMLTGGPRVPLEPPEEIVTLWIGNVPPGTSDEELAVFFKPYGTLVCCFLLKRLSKQGHLSGFVRYATKAEAAIALEAVNNGAVVINGQVASAKWASQNSKPLNNPSLATGLQMSLNGEDTIGFASDTLPEKPSLEPPPPDENGEEITTLWIGNALPGTRDEDMVAALSPYGALVCCFLLKKLSPQGQLSGFVRYSTQTEARYALEALLSGKVIVNSSVITAKWGSHNSKPLGDKAIATLLEQLPSAPPIGSTGEEITTLWIGNVDPNTTDAEFVTTMVAFGQLMCCFLLKSVSPQGQKSGFARYMNVHGAGAALQAIEAGAVAIHGQVLKARWAKENSKPLGEK